MQKPPAKSPKATKSPPAPPAAEPQQPVEVPYDPAVHLKSGFQRPSYAQRPHLKTITSVRIPPETRSPVLGLSRAHPVVHGRA